jgi:hypothetical protein
MDQRATPPLTLTVRCSPETTGFGLGQVVNCLPAEPGALSVRREVEGRGPLCLGYRAP